MKHLRRIGATLVLVLAFANVTLADDGTMFPGYVPPPPTPHPAAGTMFPGLTDNRSTAASEGETGDLATELTLILVQNLLMLF